MYRNINTKEDPIANPRFTIVLGVVNIKYYPSDKRPTDRNTKKIQFPKSIFIIDKEGMLPNKKYADRLIARLINRQNPTILKKNTCIITGIHVSQNMGKTNYSYDGI